MQLLDLNVPYLFAGAVDMLVQAAQLQLQLQLSSNKYTGSCPQQQPQQQQADKPSSAVCSAGHALQPCRTQCSSNSATNISHQGANVCEACACSALSNTYSDSCIEGSTHAHSDNARQAGARAALQQFGIGLWVCTWGGCLGLALSDALQLHRQLQALGCRLHGCDVVSCRTGSDLAMLGQLQGLESLGFRHIAGGMESTAAGSSVGSSSSSTGQEGFSAPDPSGLQGLPPLCGSLQQLTIHGWCNVSVS